MIAVFFHQREALLTVFADAKNDINGHRLSGLERNRVAYRQYRIQHGAGRVAERPVHADRLGISRAFSPADESRSVGVE